MEKSHLSMKVFILIISAGSIINAGQEKQHQPAPAHLYNTLSDGKLISTAVAQYQSKELQRSNGQIAGNGRLHGKRIPLRPKKHSQIISISFLILMMAGDIELNPGPGVKFPCGVCSKPVKCNQKGVACDTCDKWYHTRCMGMNSAIYRTLENVSWECLQCGMPNFSSSLFDNSDTISDPNIYENLTNNANSIPSFDSDNSQPSPVAHSSPIPPKQASSRLNRPLKVININFQSVNNKKAEVLLMLERDDPDIIVGTETWLKPAVKDGEILPPSYAVYRRDRPDGYGGVLLAIKSCYISEKILDPAPEVETEAVFAKVTLANDSKLIVGAIYRPTNNDLHYAEQQTKYMEKVIMKNPKAVHWILGDFNLPDIGWQTREVEGSQYPLQLNELYLDFCFNSKLEQVVEEPTRGKNVLDLFFTNRPSLVNKCRIDPGLSDHDAVYIESNLRPRKVKPVSRKIHMWRKADIDQLKASCAIMTDRFLEKFSVITPVDVMWNFLREQLLTLQSKCVPSKMSSTKYHQPWATMKVKKIGRRKKRWFKKYKMTSDPHAKQMYDQLKKESRQACKQAHNNYLNNMFSEEGGQRRFWSYIKSRKQENSGVSPLTNSNGVTISTSVEKGEILNRQFSSVFGERTDRPQPVINWNFAKMTGVHFSAEGIENLLKKLDEHKACGPDNLSAKLLKTTATEISPAVAMLFEGTLEQGVVPNDWTHAKVTPIFKKGNRALAENYRPVSLTSILCKTAEHVITSEIHRHLEEHHILTDAQHGFRKNRSCESQLLLTTNDLHLALKEVKQTDLILLDFSKAFDKVPHSLLLYKLQHYGLHHQVISWISAFLSDRTQEVLVEGRSSTTSDVTSGVPQGSVLGPLLFLMYINDLPGYATGGSTVRLFADDAVVYRRVKTTDEANLLQQDLNSLLRWEEDWGMQFHPSKCQTLRVTRKEKPVKTVYTIRGHELEEVDSAKYLGVRISNDLSWKAHVKMITGKANHTLSLLQRNISHCPKTLKDLSYKALVRPQLEYCSAIWDPHYKNQKQQIEAIQSRAARFVSSDYSRFASVSAMKQQLNWESLEARRKISRVVLMYKVLNNLIDAQLHLRPSRLHPGNYTQLHCRTATFQSSFLPDTVVLWNGLPMVVRTVATVDAFRCAASGVLTRVY